MTEWLHFHFNALEKEMATHSSVLAWRIPRMGEPGGLPSMGSHRVKHDWSDLAAAAAEWALDWEAEDGEWILFFHLMPPLFSYGNLGFSFLLYKGETSSNILISPALSPVLSIVQQSPIFSAPGISFVEDSYSTDSKVWMALEWLKHITCIVHFISIIITSVPPHIIRH